MSELQQRGMYLLVDIADQISILPPMRFHIGTAQSTVVMLKLLRHADVDFCSHQDVLQNARGDFRLWVMCHSIETAMREATWQTRKRHFQRTFYTVYLNVFNGIFYMINV